MLHRQALPTSSPIAGALVLQQWGLFSQHLARLSINLMAEDCASLEVVFITCRSTCCMCRSGTKRQSSA